MKPFMLISIAALLASCGGEKKETPAAPNADSLILPAANQVAGIGRIEPEGGLIDLSSDQAGLVRSVRIKEGDSIKTGEILFLLDNTVPAAQVTEAGSRLATENANVALAQAQIEEARVNLRKAEQDLERTRALVDRGAETRQKLDDAIADVNSRRAQLNNQLASLAVAQKKLNETREQVNTSRSTASKYTVKAPGDGLILEVNAKSGEAITVGQALAKMAPAGRLTALCEVDELFADKVAVGQKAVIRYKGYADSASTGEVIYTAPYLKKKSLFSDQVGEKEDRRVREVRILLANQDLLINRQVECVITLK